VCCPTLVTEREEEEENEEEGDEVIYDFRLVRECRIWKS
jgi:hypothetical protein